MATGRKTVIKGAPVQGAKSAIIHDYSNSRAARGAARIGSTLAAGHAAVALSNPASEVEVELNLLTDTLSALEVSTSELYDHLRSAGALRGDQEVEAGEDLAWINPSSAMGQRIRSLTHLAQRIDSLVKQTKTELAV